MQNRSRLVPAVLSALWCLCPALGADSPVDMAVRWAACFHSIESVEITWDKELPVVSMDRKRVELLRSDMFIRARWPDAFDVKTTRMRAQADAPLTSDAPAAERWVSSPKGYTLEFGDMGSKKFFRRRDYAINLERGLSSWLESAPLLAGKWLDAVGFPQGLATVQLGNDGCLTIDVPSEKVRATLAPHTVAGCSSLVLARIETLGESGNVTASYEFSDFRVPATFTTAVGFKRTTRLTPRIIPGMEDLPKMPESREDTLVEARVVPRFGADAFDVSTAGFQEIDKPKEPAKNGPGAAIDEAHTTPATALTVGSIFGWLSGVGAGLLIAATFVFTRAKFGRQ